MDEAIRSLLLLMPRMVGRTKRMPVPAEFASVHLTARHLSLLACLLFDGPTGVNELAGRLAVAPTTVSLMVSTLSRAGILERREDEADRRRKIVSISEAHRPGIDTWLGGSAGAWRTALTPLTPRERALVVRTLLTYEDALSREQESRE
ncbi:MarR family transcriptional regulator [Streptomyces sp. NPDC049954]|uniref:MarR family transcriptional regulator n=1 Tax=Streptomyces sp. NPDC049954 TaxID=3155779 RepID=UPI00343D8421